MQLRLEEPQVSRRASKPPRQSAATEPQAEPAPGFVQDLLLNRLMLAVAWLVEAIVPRLRRGAVLALANLLGTGGYLYLRCSGKRMRVALANLEVAFGKSLSPAEAQAIVRRSMVNVVLVILDLFWFSRDRERRIEKYVDFGPGFEPGFYKQNYICITAHFGNWELLGQALAQRGCPALMPYAPLRFAGVQQVLDRLRHHPRLQFVSRSVPGAGIAVFRALREGRSVGLLLDQNVLQPQVGGFVRMFGLPVAAPLVLGRIAQQSGVPIVPAFCIPQPKGRYYIFRRPALQVGDSLPGGFDDVAVTQWAMDQFEEEITRRPELWFWLHRRWKHIPPEAESSDKFPFYARPLAA